MYLGDQSETAMLMPHAIRLRKVQIASALRELALILLESCSRLEFALDRLGLRSAERERERDKPQSNGVRSN